MSETIQESKISTFISDLTKTKLPFRSEILQTALNTLETEDFPTTRNEAWKYTRTAKIANLKLQDQTVETVNSADEFILSKDAYRLVFIDGEFNSDLSDLNYEKGLIIKPLSSCTAEELNNLGSRIRLEKEIFNSINTLYAKNGLYIQVEEKAIIQKPVQILHILSGNNKIANLRNYVELGQFSEVSILQGFFSHTAESSFVNVVSELFLHSGAHLKLDKLQTEEEGNFHINTEQVVQESDSTFTISTTTLNGSFVRNNLNILVEGENCNTNLNGAYLLRDRQHVDNHTVVDHLAPHCDSNELYKGVIDENATAVFNGKVFVRKDSQKINAFQSNGNVLLSDNATINSKPELEIYADDVKCSHGSTTGQLDENAIFYLRARGLSEQSARNLLVSAFIEDVLAKISSKEMNAKIHSIIKDRFDWDF